MLLLNVVPWIMVSLHEDSTFSGTNVFLFSQSTGMTSQSSPRPLWRRCVDHDQQHAEEHSMLLIFFLLIIQTVSSIISQNKT